MILRDFEPVDNYNQMENAATPAVQPDGTPAVAPAAAPAETNADMVQVSKEKLDQLERDAARAATAQREAAEARRKAALYDRTMGKSHASPFSRQPAPAAAPTEEEMREQASREDAKAERLIMRLAAEPKYRALLDADPTLRDLMVNNPLAVLPALAPDAIDAEDALALVTEKLDARLTTISTPAPVAPAPATAPAPAVDATKKSVDERVAEAQKAPHLRDAIAGTIAARLSK